MKYFRCGKNLNLFFFPLFMALFWCFRSYVNLLLGHEHYTGHILFTTALMFLGEITGGAFELASQLRSKRVNVDIESQMVVYNGELFRKQSITSFQISHKFYFYLLIFACTAFDFFTINGIFIISLFDGMFNLPIQMRIIQTIFTGILCYIVLKTVMYKHQIISCVSIIIGLVLISYSTLNVILESMAVFGSVIGFDLLLSCQEVFEKYILLNMGISVYRLLFLEGLFGFCLTTIFLISANYVDCQWAFCGGIGHKVENFSLMFSAINWKIGVYLVLFYLGSFGLNIFAMLTNYFFTPTHKCVSYTFYSFCWWLLMLIIDYSNQSTSIGLHVIGYIFIIFGSLVYNEIVILQFCSLDQYTKEDIIKRSHLESLTELMVVVIEGEEKLCSTI